MKKEITVNNGPTPTACQSELVLECFLSDTVSDLKAKIAEMTGISVDSQRFLFGGKTLEDDQTLESYDMRAEIIDLVPFVQHPLHTHSKIQDCLKKFPVLGSVTLYLTPGEDIHDRMFLVESTQFGPKGLKMKPILQIEKDPTVALIANSSRKKKGADSQSHHRKDSESVFFVNVVSLEISGLTFDLEIPRTASVHQLLKMALDEEISFLDDHAIIDQ
eukprot:TRINITY_DN8507_c0_g1_i1.p1 TRINITY_DN8507_c0_g1~~TRINITY_DN8507_c0_g1_i1.p1  ORF type:complete len:245 (-),score=50.93 TRINITY_DN8507_c0_g1_i1:74-727(-)